MAPLARPLTWLRRLFGRRPARPAGMPVSALSTWQVTDPQRRDVELRYAPSRNGGADAGEIVWGFVPFAESPTEGKDRPLLVIARHDTMRVYALKLTSRPPAPGSSRHLSIGTGAWDRERRESWVDLDQLYSVHVRGIRREAAALDRRVFDRVAQALSKRYGWRRAG